MAGSSRFSWIAAGLVIAATAANGFLINQPVGMLSKAKTGACSGSMSPEFQIMKSRIPASLSLSNLNRRLHCTTKMSAVSEDVDCLVIGGGIYGLATAFYAAKAGKNVLLTEKDSKFGGNIETRSADGYLWEDGPNTFQPTDTMLQLISDLNLSDQLVVSDPKLPRYVFSNNDMFALPAGGGPPKDLLRLLSPLALIRAALGALLPLSPSPAGADETVAAFVTRSLGPEVLEKIVDPFISTVYAGDPSKMSMRSVFPAIKSVADKSGGAGGLAFAFIKDRSAAKKAAAAAAPAAAALPAVPRGASCSLKGGLAALPAAAAAALGERCRAGWEATALARDGAGGGYTATFSTAQGARTVRARSVVVAVPPAAAAALLAPLAPAAAAAAGRVTAPPVFSVTLAYPAAAVDPARPTAGPAGGLRGFGVLIPRSAGIDTLGFQFLSSLFPGRSPAGQEAVLAYYGGAQNPNVAGMDEAAVVERVHADAQRTILSPGAPPPKVLSVRLWPRAIPQYNQGHAALIDAARAALPPGVLLGGSFAGGGVSLGDCVTAARAAAAQAAALAAP